MRGTVVVYGSVLFGIVGVVVVKWVGVGGFPSLRCMLLFFFKVGSGDEDGSTEFTDVDATEGGVLFDVEPEVKVYESVLTFQG